MGYDEELRIWANKRVAEYKRQQLSMADAQRQWVYDQDNRGGIEKSTVLGTFKSKTSKGRWTVTKHLGNIRCNCPGFVFRRNCRHIKEAIA
jgi:hypothetical protein